jgi:acetyl-CoA carboxylase carboxyl transferase subunit beta
MPIKLPFRQRREREEFPADLWTQCPNCKEMLYTKQLEKSFRVCSKCGHHLRLRVDARLTLLLDQDSFEERDAGLESLDPLGFVDSKPYPERLAAARATTGIRDAAIWGHGTIAGTRVAICVMDFAFMGGSMGSVVGEKVTRAAEGARDERVPLIVVSASGGARMQEGTLALMQLAKTVAALERLARAGVPYISILTDPTTGGVFASFAALGDVNIAEPESLIGFAGARVAAGTTGEALPEGFQRAEFLYAHGFVDQVVARGELRDRLAQLLGYLKAPPAPPREDVNVNGRVMRSLAFIDSLTEGAARDNGSKPADGSARPAGATSAGADVSRSAKSRSGATTARARPTPSVATAISSATAISTKPVTASIGPITATNPVAAATAMIPISPRETEVVRG